MRTNKPDKNEIALKVYRSPQLSIFGNITELTHNAGATSGTPDDDSRGAADKFSA
jgi:hypothetical protein